MPIQIVMPTLSPTMDKGKLAKWRVKEGQQVKPGDVICEVETDKATIEVEAVDAGRVARLLVAEGTADVKVNTPIAFLEGEGTSSRGAGALTQRVGPGAAALRRHERDRHAAAAPRCRPHRAPRGAERGRRHARRHRHRPRPPQGRSRATGSRRRVKGTVSPTVGIGLSGGAGKTQYIRAEGLEVDPVAGWVVVVQGPAAAAFARSSSA